MHNMNVLQEQRPSNLNQHDSTENNEEAKQSNRVKNHEDDGNGFFITGINTHEQ